MLIYLKLTRFLQLNFLKQMLLLYMIMLFNPNVILQLNQNHVTYRQVSWDQSFHNPVSSEIILWKKQILITC